jgi:hypothetical protein
MATGRIPNHIKFSNRHRVELRSMIKLMRPGGDFTPVWVRSHQEHEHTDNAELEAQRAALAMADELATESHAAAGMQSYGELIQWDKAHVLDDRELPVVGNVRTALERRQQTRRKSHWREMQAERGPARVTAQHTDVDTASVLAWNDHQRRFYWRAISNTLHTNAKKHRIHARWNPACRLCEHGAIDTPPLRAGRASVCNHGPA